MPAGVRSQPAAYHDKDDADSSTQRREAFWTQQAARDAKQKQQRVQPLHVLVARYWPYLSLGSFPIMGINIWTARERRRQPSLGRPQGCTNLTCGRPVVFHVHHHHESAGVSRSSVHVHRVELLDGSRIRVEAELTGGSSGSQAKRARS